MTARRPDDRRGERGAALLMTLVLVAAMSAVAVAMTDTLRFAARRAANAEARDQALWYVLGAEELARQVLRRDWETDPSRTSLDAPWAAAPVSFPTDAGLIEAVITDRSNCFNVNSLATPEEALGYGVDYEARDELAAVAVAFDVREADARRLAATAADWIDLDDAPSGSGAEDFDYAAQRPPYRAANTLFGEIEEMRALAGVDPEVLRALRPYLCALPTTDRAVLNVNTLTEDGAPLLSAVLGGALTIDEARSVIAARPFRGWSSAQEFWASERLETLAVGEAARARVKVTSDYFQLDSRVRHRDAFAEARSLLHRTGGQVRVVRRRIGSFE